ncbi:phosphatase 2C-like domain-containing protein [Collybia nuda]|uniref:Phosphatase 2C-like domain-containing protein n=1 Tax=Collybia nuda TaxID=64659 RepID=A0A9P6CK09_9AGAR|nr:phosphatase 2C-like domain-containing protein [Collybia nuda]
MLRHAWKPVAATVVIGTPAYLYFRSRPDHHQTFDLPVRIKGAGGKAEMSTRTLPLLPMSTLEARIREHATVNSHSRPGGPVWNYATAALASNDPIEDANCAQVIQRDESDPSAPGDYLFFAVMDGHGGHNTSQLLSRVLIKAVALELSTLAADPQATSIPGLFENLKGALWGSPAQNVYTALDSNPQQVSKAISDAFAKLDSELLNAPIRILADNLDEESRKSKVVPDLSQHPLALSTMLPAISGSCALMAVFDTAHRDLYIACTGDSRAVAGVWERTVDGKGRWRVEVLSEDQTGRNPNELKRVQSEHPKDEADYVIREGRILGGLEPSRAFGDARYKWPRAIQKTLSQAFLVGNGRPMRPAPSLFKTPPYVIARPVVTHRKLSFSTSAERSTEKAVHFLVLATDGLWDQLSSEDVVSLVGGHLAGLKGTIPKSNLPSLVPTSSGTPTVEGKNKKRSQNESWAFTDDNVGAHLIRNAFGGGDETSLRQVLSIPAPLSRRYRDDVTVTVVWWEDGNEDEARVTSITEKLKAKL